VLFVDATPGGKRNRQGRAVCPGRLGADLGRGYSVRPEAASGALLAARL